MENVITINRATLSDGSEVYNVIFGSLMLSAVTECDAVKFANKVQHAIHEHTVDYAEVRFDY